MARFLAEIEGQRGKTSRLGSKKSGISGTVASWEGSVYVRLWHDEETGRDMADVALAPWHNAGVSRQLYSGPVSGSKSKRVAP
jgi:hypothetical protein